MGMCKDRIEKTALKSGAKTAIPLDRIETKP